ncbi:M20 family metallopeptidase [Streptomyces sp. ODS28]|uniref:M20 metallopeptidase family protein n=1 Tax=Streptomyces sp. ODS28 TaxID=3136688 RepID=UPI0031F0E69A
MQHEQNAGSAQEAPQGLQEELVALRRDLHREPETGLHLPRTQAKVLAALDGLGLEISTGERLSSVTAVLRGGACDGQGPVVLLRGDMDALPVQEESGEPYASEVPGAMHACGHDLHTAGLVGAAKLLAARRAELAGDVVFMFQPGEEEGGGARLMIEEGVLDAAGRRADAAYGLHVAANTLPLGLAATRPGALLAASDTLRVTVNGQGGHGSSPHAAQDPVPAACAMVTALQTMVTREFDAYEPVVISVGLLRAGTAANVIPDTAHFEATVRTLSEERRSAVREAASRTVRGIAEAHGLSCEVAYEEGYPVTANDPSEAAYALEVAREVFGARRVLEAPRPMSGAEDFSFVLREVPGAYLFLGATPPGADPVTAPFNHSPRAVFDDAVLGDGALLLAELAASRLRHR